MIIEDGYTQHAEFDGKKFSYRPALYSERVEFWRGHHTQKTVVEFINRHVVWKEKLFLGTEQDALFLICFGVVQPEKGGDWAPEWEARDARNLWEGVILDLRHPQIARRKCEDCKKWWYDEETGKVTLRGGNKLLRPLDTVTACQTNEGCPKGTPENQKSLSQKNREAYRHFLECEAVRQFPDDPIVRHNARIIRRATAAARR